MRETGTTASRAADAQHMLPQKLPACCFWCVAADARETSGWFRHRKASAQDHCMLLLLAVLLRKAPLLLLQQHTWVIIF
jgi:hypothetical protein